MKLDDLVFEVRSGDLSRVGQVTHNELDFNATIPFNNVGEWTLRLRDEHPMVPELKKPGAGLCVTGPGNVVLLSGPVVEPSFEATPEDRQGTTTFTGVTDEIILQDMLAWPEPGNPNVSTQAVGEDVREGAAETLMHQYVNLNAGPGAPAARRVKNLVMGTNYGRGAVVKHSARFPMLGEVLNDIAAASQANAPGSNPLGFRIRQKDKTLVFETYETVDRSDIVKLSVRNSSLAGQKVTVAAPTITRAIVGGKGEKEDRNIIEVSNDLSTGAESDWGRRIEVFVDHRQEEGTDELTQAGGEALTQGGSTFTKVELIPAENTDIEFGTDWNLGDMVAAEIDDESEAHSYVSGYAFAVSAQEGFIFGATLSDALVVKTNGVERRVSAMERTEVVPAKPTINVVGRNFAPDMGGQNSYSNGSYTTIGSWTGTGYPASAQTVDITVSCNGRSDINSAGYFELLVQKSDGSYLIVDQSRVHNNAVAALGLGTTLTACVDLEEIGRPGNVNVFVNLNVDSGGGWIQVGPIHGNMAFKAVL